jgi:murein DD-endopeptidase MepM/ murein hydrolase activator NlpD
MVVFREIFNRQEKKNSSKAATRLKKQYYILFVARDEDGYLNKVPIPMRYAYIFLAVAVVGAFTVAGLFGSYSRMLVKTESFNQIRDERETLRRNYQQLEQVTQEKDVQVASLGSLANEVSALYGLRQSKAITAAAQPVQASQPVIPATDNEFSQENYTQSVDEFDALRTSALDGVATQALSLGVQNANSLDDWAALAAAPSLWPVEGRITSSFGERLDPFNGEGAFHAGMDIAADIGTPIHATADGLVVKAEIVNGYGREIEIDHGHDIKTCYGHLSGFTVTAGQQVTRGEVIGYVGDSGRSTGAHLHYEVRIHDTPVNPYKYLRTTVAEMLPTDAASTSTQ